MRNLFTSFLSTGIIQVANLVTGILAARLLMPEGRGELALLLLWPVLVADLGSLGLNTAISYMSARGRATSRQIFSATAWLSALLTPALIGVYAVAVVIVFADKRPDAVAMAWILAALIPVHLYSLSLISQFQGQQRFGQFNFLRSMVHLAYLVFVLLLLATSRSSAPGFAAAYMGATAATGIVALTMAIRLGWPSLAPDRQVMRETLRYGVRVHVGSMLHVANRRLDQLLISVTLAVSDLGLYVVAVAVAGIPLLITTTTDLIAFPKMAEQDDDEGRRLVLGRYLRATLLLAVPCIGAMILLAPEFIDLLFGPSFVPAADLSRVLLLSGVAFAFRVLLATYLRAGDRMMIVSKVEAAGVAVTAASLLVLVPTLGIMGAAIAQLVATTLPVFLCIALIRREQAFDLVDLLTPRQAELDVFREAVARLRPGI